MENGKKERVHVLERRAPITKSEFQSPGEQHGKGVGGDAKMEGRISLMNQVTRRVVQHLRELWSSMRLSMPEIGVKRLRGSKGRVRQTKRGQSVSKGAIAGKENKKECQTSGSSTRKVRKKGLCGRRK